MFSMTCRGCVMYCRTSRPPPCVSRIRSSSTTFAGSALRNSAVSGSNARRVRLSECIALFEHWSKPSRPRADEVRVAGDARGVPQPQQQHAFVRVRVVADEVADAEDALDAAFVEP